MLRSLLIPVMYLHAVILKGQLWPEGAPLFLRAANIAFLMAMLVHLLRELLGRR